MDEGAEDRQAEEGKAQAPSPGVQDVQAAVHNSTLFNMYTNESLATYLVFCIVVEC